MLAALRSTALWRFILLFAVMYAAFGVASPFLPAFLEAGGLGSEQIGLILAGGTAIRLLSGPAAGRLADRLGALRCVLGACIALAAVAALGYLPASGLVLLLLVNLFHAAALAPSTTLADALALPQFRRLMAVAALVLGSHAMHDAFAVIRWSAAGIDPPTASVLWSESVAAEVIVFFIIGPSLIARLGPAGAMALAAAAGVLRWIVMAHSADVVALVLMQPLHGLTFALFHLACMRLLVGIVPPGLAATAQAIYGTLAVGATTAVLTLLSGLLYARLGAHGFWVMAVLCAAALPFTRGFSPPIPGCSRPTRKSSTGSLRSF